LSADHVTAGDETLTIPVQVSKNGGAFVNLATPANATHIDPHGCGWYYIDLAIADTGTPGPIIVRGTEATIDPAETVYDVVAATNAGFTALPNAAADAAGGLPISDAGGLDMDNITVTLKNGAHGGTSATIVLSATQPIKADVSYWGGYAIAYVNQAGVPLVDLCYINGTTIAGTSTQVAASFLNMFNVAAGSMRLTVASYNQGADNNTILASVTYGNNALLTAIGTRMATFTLPTYFSVLSIDAVGKVTYVNTAPPTAAVIADAVLDEAAAGHTGVIVVNLDAKVSEVGGGTGLTAQETRDAMKLAPTAGDPAAASVDKHLDDLVPGSPVNITVEDSTKVVIS